ncbi:MAG: hypothetical protein ACD_41C00358G0004 [uncultured bacterium]|nr:MAG: hypothetical protein ACD_41C00358G0004 [uncultured bacterium]
MDFPSPPQQPQPLPPQPVQPQPVPPQPVQIPVQSHDEPVYTMPDKFIPANQSAVSPTKRPKKTLTIVLIIVIVLAVLGIIGGVVFYVLRVMNNTPVVTDAQNAVVVNTNNSTVVANVNANENDNDNVNNNENANLNEDVNANLNVNDNTNATVNKNVNLNENANLNANANVNENDNTNKTVVVAPVPSKDTDEDSLTNEEEKIWGTKADLPDTDSDGYADGVEIMAGYDPTNATSAGRLADSVALVSTFANDDYNYTLLYPKNWLAESSAEADYSEILITPSSLDLAGQFISVTVIPNPTGFTAVDWFVDTTEVDESTIVTFATFADAIGVFSTDGTTAYLASSDYIYAISYRFGNSPELYFPTTFQMVVKSLVLTEPKKRTNTNDNTNAASD